MPRGGPRPGAGRPVGSKTKRVVKNNLKAKKDNNNDIMPFEYMLDIMRDENEPDDRRDKMAYYLLPYLYPKASMAKGKKEERDEKAKLAGAGRFSASQPPKLKALK